MKKKKYFKTIKAKLPLPVFFPDATQAVIKSLDSSDIESTKTPGVLINTYHLYRQLGQKVIENHDNVRKFMSWQRGLISDSGGFQVMTLAKAGCQKGNVTDKGVIFHSSKKKKILFTPEKSIQFQMILKPDMVVVLDDFTEPNASYEKAKETVDRTVLWAKRSKEEFVRCCQKQGLTEKTRPYILAVVQGGDYLDLRKECAERLSAIGFDGFGYGGWPITKEGKFNYEVAKCIADSTPKDYFLYGLGIGKPEEIVGCVDLGYHIFDCVLPTRDARHKRLYVYNADSIDDIDIRKPKFYSYFVPDKEKYYQDNRPVSSACDCLLCTRYSRAYLAHLFRIKEFTAGRLATIHNLRFYSILMEKLQANSKG
ncbi:tRNA-guanine transglycosylase [Candidatus Microgenomates bacterium]|nr:tRNA-guanine transglycosylase [Candidatus Microgenomates bacterium]